MNSTTPLLQTGGSITPLSNALHASETFSIGLRQASWPTIPGSHTSPGWSTPSPQTMIDVHTLGSASSQSKKGSTLHAAEQPSPLVRLSSSHSSPATTVASPQMPLQPLAEQMKPF